VTDSSKLRELRTAVREGRDIISVHYACESLTEAKDHPPKVSCIGVARRNSGTREGFSLADLPPLTPEAEREIALFERFYDYLIEHRESLIVHWNMNSSVYGFAALGRRYCYITGKEHPRHVPPEHLLYDLDDIIGELYGEQYVKHPKFYNLASLNEIGLFSYLSGKDEASQFKAGNLGAISGSTTTKARANIDILEALLNGRLRTQRSAGSVDFGGRQIDAVDTVLAIAKRMRNIEREIARRYDSRATLEVRDEHDAGDLLKALLALFFDDVRTSGRVPPYANGAESVDCFIPQFELALIVKHVVMTEAARNISAELTDDVSHYKTEGRARHLIVLIFDYEGTLSSPRGLEADWTSDYTVDGLVVTVKIMDR
jgi:hypothetical protein